MPINLPPQTLENTPIACTLDDFSFLDFECPNDQIQYFGGTQKIVKHEFPGGEITTQTFGAFPPEMIKWSGQFFQDEARGDLYDRVDQINQMRVNGQEMTLTVGRFVYQVLLHKFELGFRMQFWIPYNIELVPTFDLNASSYPQTPAAGTAGTNGTIATAPPIPSPAPGTGQASITNAANNGIATAPSSPSQVFHLSASNDDLNQGIKSAGNYPNLPAGLTPQMTDFQQNLNNAIQQALNNKSSINTPALQASLTETQEALAPLIKPPASNAPTIALSFQEEAAQKAIATANAAFAVTNNAILENIRQILNATPPIADLKKVINPNLNLLAIQYYGDATLWEAIGNAQVNRILVPNPVGEFSLIIPSLESVRASGIGSRF